MNEIWNKIAKLDECEINDLYNFFIITESDELMFSDRIYEISTLVYNQYTNINDFIKELDRYINTK